MPTERRTSQVAPRETLCACATAVLRLQSREVARNIDAVCVEAWPGPTDPAVRQTIHSPYPPKLWSHFSHVFALVSDDCVIHRQPWRSISIALHRTIDIIWPIPPRKRAWRHL